MPGCNGRRYRQHILDVKLAGPDHRAWSIGDSRRLPSTRPSPSSAPSRVPSPPDAPLTAFNCSSMSASDTSLRCGQPINTLSGGESQRLKLVSHLANWASTGTKSTAAGKPTLFLFDEPTTGLHFEDIRVWTPVFQRMVDKGHSVVVVEHNLDVIRQADWVIHLGPDAGGPRRTPS